MASAISVQAKQAQRAVNRLNKKRPHHLSPWRNVYDRSLSDQAFREGQRAARSKRSISSPLLGYSGAVMDRRLADHITFHLPPDSQCQAHPCFNPAQDGPTELHFMAFLGKVRSMRADAARPPSLGLANGTPRTAKRNGNHHVHVVCPVVCCSCVFRCVVAVCLCGRPGGGRGQNSAGCVRFFSCSDDSVQ